MNRETFKTQLSELFPGESLSLLWGNTGNSAMITIKRKLTRLEIGNLFSLGINSLNNSPEGTVIKFDLNKAELNFQVTL